MNPSFWRGKKVFLTGHTGFKGTWLSLWLQQLGAQVTGYALPPPTHPSLFEVAQVAQGMTSIIGDIRDVTMLSNAMRQAAPDIVIHMAAQPLVRRSYVDPVETYSTNVMGTVHLLESIRQTPTVRAVVNVTSDKCYENKEWVWGYRESEPMGGFDPYSSSKGCAELVSAAYRNSYFNIAKHAGHPVAMATARAGNVIGGGDWSENRLIPDILRAIEKSQCVSVRNPQAIRPWQHVLEPLSGYLVLAKELSEKGFLHREPFNFGPKTEQNYTVSELVAKLSSYWDSAQNIELKEDHSPPPESQLLKLNCDKAQNILKWETVLDLDETIQFTAEWYLGFQKAPDDIRCLTENQIDKYSDLAVMRGIKWAK